MFKKTILKTVSDIEKNIQDLPTPERKISAAYYLLAILALCMMGYFFWTRFDNSDKTRLNEKDAIIIQQNNTIIKQSRTIDSLTTKIFNMNLETIRKLEKLVNNQEVQKQQLRNIK